MKKFEIRKNNCALSMKEIDAIAADFFGVEISEKWVAPKGYPWCVNWFECIGHPITNCELGKHEWSDIIGQIARIAAMGERSYESFISGLELFKPFIELCIHFKSLGYIPVTVE